MSSCTRKEDSFGNVSWFDINGILHRENGPAVEHADGLLKRWYFHGLYVACTTQAEFEQKVGLKSSVPMYGIRCICLIDPAVSEINSGRDGWTKTDRGWETWYAAYNPFTDINNAHLECSLLKAPNFIYCVEEV